MELVYLWVEDYKNIHQQGFNFSGRYRCDYDHEKNELTIDENKEYVHIFPDNINITAIVGENGSGKSNILEYIIQNLLHHVQSNLRTVTFDNNKFVIESYNLTNPTIANNTKIQNIEFKQYETKKTFRNVIQYESFHALSDYEIIYYSLSPFDRCNIYQSFSQFHYLGVLNEYGQFNIQDILIKQIKNFIQLSQDEALKKILALLKLPIPETILLNPKDFFYSDEQFWRRICSILDIGGEGLQEEFQSKLIELYNQCRDNMDKNSVAKKNFLYLHFFIETMKMLITNSSSKLLFTKQTSDFLNEYNTDLILAIKHFFTNTFIDEIKNHPNESVHNLIDKFDQISTIELNSHAYTKNPIHNQFVINIEKIDNHFLTLLKNTNVIDSFELSWINNGQHIRLSSGEIAILNLLVNITTALQNAINNHKSRFIIMLDEIELFLHPKWQKKYMKNIITAIESVLGSKKCHILLTSHSPFILSDIPKECVNFIGEKFVHEQTFGANIHTLLSNGFFMNDGLMGEFAKEKISQILFLLSGEIGPINIPNEQIKPIIKIIGEDFLREKLLKMYDEKFLTKEAQIARLQKQIDELKNAKN